MVIHPFIFTWPNQNPLPTIEAWKRLFGEVTVINSGEPVEGWVNLGGDAYFTAQWLTALDLFRGDILFHCQADATCDDWERVVERGLALYQKYEWDNFAPFVDYTYHVRTLEELEPAVYRVPINDCTCWMLHRRLISRYLDLNVDWRSNRFGWGHDAVMGALAEMAIRDHSITVRHPRHTGYCSQAARTQMQAMFQLLPPEIRGKIAI